MSEKETNLYSILGVKKSASKDELRSAYRKLAREFHPDVNPGDKVAEDRFKAIAAAYEVLSDETKRKGYDEFGAESLRGGFDPEQARAYADWKVRREQGGRPFEREYVDLEDLFGGAYGGQAYAARGADIYAIAELGLEQVIHGTEVSIAGPGLSKATRVRIPQGAATGDTIRLRGRGGPGAAGGAAGDLIIETRVAPHPRVKRSGQNLRMSIPVTLSEAYSGAVIEVPTFTGIVKVTIPPGSQNGTTLRLRNKGVHRKEQQGDFYIELEVRMPETMDPELESALKQGQRLYKQPVRAGVKL